MMHSSLIYELIYPNSCQNLWNNIPAWCISVIQYCGLWAVGCGHCSTFFNLSHIGTLSFFFQFIAEHSKITLSIYNFLVNYHEFIFHIFWTKMRTYINENMTKMKQNRLDNSRWSKHTSCRLISNCWFIFCQTDVLLTPS